MRETGDELPEVELVGRNEAYAESEVVVASKPPRRRAVALAAVVGLLAVAVVASQQDNGGSEARQPSPSASTTIERASTTTGGGESETPAGFYLSGGPQPVFDGVVEGSLLLGGQSGTWRQVDLATGWVASLPESAMSGVDRSTVVPLRGGVAFSVRNGSALRFLALPDIGPDVDLSEVESTGFKPDVSNEPGNGVLGIMSAGPDDRLWVTTFSDLPEGLHASLVGIDGHRLTGPFPVPAIPVAGTEHGVVFNAGGHGFLVDENGITDLGDGEVYAASGSFAGRVYCNQVAQCHQQIVDVARPGVAARGGFMPTDAAAHRSVTMAVRSDGSLAAIPVRIDHSNTGPFPGRTTSLYVTLRGGGQPERVVVDNARSGPVWLPDDAGLVILTGSGLVHYTEIDDDITVVPLGGIRAGDASAVFFVPEENSDPQTSP